MVAKSALSAMPLPAAQPRGAPGPIRHAVPRRQRLLRVMPTTDLLAMAAALRDPLLYGVLSGEGLAPEQIADLVLGFARPPSVRRPLHPLLRRGVAVHSFEVDDYQSKSVAVERVGSLGAQLGLRRRACDAVEQAVDELLLNALYDAPVDRDGRPRYARLGLAERVGVRVERRERPVVRCAGDEDRFVVAVRDPFGSLRRETITHYLHRCAEAHLQRSSPVEFRPGGAGVGLYLIAICATELFFRLRGGRLTEVIYAIATRPPAPPPLRALVIDDEEGVT